MSSNYYDHLNRLRRIIPSVSASEAADLTAIGAVMLDVREPEETELGHVPDARLVPLALVEHDVQAVIPKTDTPVIAYCAHGIRSLFAADTLKQLGYTNVVSMDGGFEAWQQAGLPWQPPQQLNAAQTERYARHLRIPEIGIDGQQRLLQSRVLMIGAGGLGSPAAFYLAAAGVGTIGIIDDDVVDVSNLQRQILHRTEDIGKPKVESARRTIASLNPDVQVQLHAERLTEANVREIFADYDLVVDGSDSFETRYVVNDACVALGIPQIHGSIFRFDGQVTTFDPRRDDSPCYRCLFPSPPPPEMAPNCAIAGVLGVLPGVIGTIQATEAIKLSLGIGEPLVGRLLMYDALEMTFRTLKIRRDDACPTCGHAIIGG